MKCPRCESERIQRDYDDTFVIARLVGFHKLLCNNCGLVFKRFVPFEKVVRAPVKGDLKQPNRRQWPRYRVHIPTAIALIENSSQAGKVTYAETSRGHCETLSKAGMGLSLVGARFPEGELSRLNRLLFIRLDLPEAAVEAVTSIVSWNRIEDAGKRKWFLGVKIVQMSDDDTAHLVAFMQKRAEDEPAIISE